MNILMYFLCRCWVGCAGKCRNCMHSFVSFKIKLFFV